MILFNCKTLLFMSALNLCAYYGFCQQSTYSAGYREIKSVDSTRRYQPSASADNPLFYRPIQLDIWFPAIKKPDEKTLDYSFFLSLFERRANSFQNDAKYDSLATELLRHFTIGNGKQPAHLPTRSLPDPIPASGRFPVIVYLCSFNGMSYENVPLFEKLAEAGYYVMAISSVGHYPGNMTTQYPDVQEQTKDALFAINHTSNPAADRTRL